MNTFNRMTLLRGLVESSLGPGPVDRLWILRLLDFLMAKGKISRPDALKGQYVNNDKFNYYPEPRRVRNFCRHLTVTFLLAI